MGDSYVEVLVKKQSKPWYSFVKGLLGFSTVWMFVVLGIMQVNVIFIVLGAVMGVVFYFVCWEMDLEYEYLYVNGELSVDKIMGKASRKQCVVITFDQVEIVAPTGSWHLSDYTKQNCAKLDYSSATGDDNVYAMYYKGKKGLTKLLFEPNAKMIEAMKMNSPRKVFTE